MSSKKNNSDKYSKSHDVDLLEAIERKALWLSSWLIHNANHVRPNKDGLKVGGHQASCASAVTLLTVLYMSVLRPEDKIAIKQFCEVQATTSFCIRRGVGRFKYVGNTPRKHPRTLDYGGKNLANRKKGSKKLIQSLMKNQNLSN